MRYLINFLCIVFICGSLIADADVVLEQHHHEQAPKFDVRVLLNEKEVKDPCWEIETDDTLVIFERDNPDNRASCKGVKINVTEQGLHVVDDRGRERNNVVALCVVPKDGYFLLDGTWYQGSLYFFKEGAKGLCVNSINIEDYVFSVVKAEGWPDWPCEMNKVMAVVSRSYVIAKVLEAQKQGKLYHIKNTNIHQTYKGYHDCFAIKKAVEETSGLFLAHKNQPILAMFDICCGGIIPAKKKGVNFTIAPYLARKHACTFCKTYKHYKWSAEYSIDDLEKIFQKEVTSLKNLKEIKVNKKDGAGIVQQVTFKTRSGYHYVSGKRIYSLLKNVKSFCFSVLRRAKSIVFKGRGYGHHMGLCQWGARQMVREAWPWEKIVHYYYPGIEVMKLQSPESQELIYAEL